MGVKQRLPFLRSSVWRLGLGLPRFIKTGQFGDGREAACAAYVEANARRGDVDDVLATIDKFATEESMLVNVGDEKGELLDAAVRRADPKLALELGTYCGYSSLRIARAAPDAKVYSVEFAAANAEVARRIWAHAGVDDRVTCVVGTIGDGGLDARCADRRPRFRRRNGRSAVHRPRQEGLSLRSAEHSRPQLAAQGIHRRRRQRPRSRRPQVPRVHARTAGQAVEHR